MIEVSLYGFFAGVVGILTSVTLLVIAQIWITLEVSRFLTSNLMSFYRHRDSLEAAFVNIGYSITILSAFLMLFFSLMYGLYTL